MPNIFPTESFSLKEYHRIPDDLKENWNVMDNECYRSWPAVYINWTRINTKYNKYNIGSESQNLPPESRFWCLMLETCLLLILWCWFQTRNPFCSIASRYYTNQDVHFSTFFVIVTNSRDTFNYIKGELTYGAWHNFDFMLF